jgi:HD-like signal output (HDOD) protein
MSAAVDQKICNSCQRVYRSELDFLRDTSSWRRCSDGNLWFDCSCRSTLVIPNGKYSWFRADRAMEPSVGAVFNRIASLKELPHIPNAVMSLLVEAQDPECDVSRLAKKVKREPFIADEVYRIASRLRDARIPAQEPLQSIEHAIVYVGLKVLEDILVAASIKTFRFKSEKFRSEDFWRDAEVGASIAEYFARKVGVNSDEAFHAALLVNIGKVVMAICLPNQIDMIHDLMANPDTTGSWVEIETKFVFASHIQLGQIGASLWGLSDFVQEAIQYHHEAESVKFRSFRHRDRRFYATVFLANQLTHWVHLRPERIDTAVMHANAEILGLSDANIEASMKEVQLLLAV